MSQCDKEKSVKVLSKTRLKWIAAFATLSILTAILNPESTYSLFPKPTPIVEISDGLVQGRVAYSRNGTEYFEFLGIPYAEPPLNGLRFLPPVPVSKWSGVKKVMSSPSMCTQVEWVTTQRLAGSDDCLTINVAAPPFNATGSKNGRLYPVLVNIPGGGFLFGGSKYYGPNYFMDSSNIVVVTFNYRVGAQGFLNFAQSPEEYKENPLPRGNMGLKDQVMALEWVQKNIEYFGGDSRMVTLYGQSAGGVSAHFHMLSARSRSKNLFHRVIAHSGTALSPWAFTSKPRILAEKLAKEFGCSLENKENLMQCLQSADPNELALFPKWPLRPISEPDVFIPSLETVTTDDTFISLRPYELLKNGSIQNIPVILGMNSGDGALAISFFDKVPEFVEKVEANWTNLAGQLLGFHSFPANLSGELRRFYFPEYTSFTENPKLFKERLATMSAEVVSYEGAHSTAQIHLQHQNASSSVRLFLYDYRSTGVPGFYSIYKAVRPGDWFPPEVMIPYTIAKDWIEKQIFGGQGAHEYKSAHTDDMFLLWVVDPLSSLMFSKQDLEFSKAYVNFIIDFAKGKDETLSFRGVPWPKIDKVDSEKESMPYMLFDENGKGSFLQGPFTEGIKFWKTLGIRNFN